jgi:hypothetical protein
MTAGSGIDDIYPAKTAVDGDSVPGALTGPPNFRKKVETLIIIFRVISNLVIRMGRINRT